MNNYNDEREELRQKVELFHALQRLKLDPSFKKLILNGFCRDEVINLTRQASHEMTAEAKIAKSQQAQAGPVLEAYLIRVGIEGESAREKQPILDAMIAEEDTEVENLTQ